MPPMGVGLGFWEGPGTEPGREAIRVEAEMGRLPKKVLFRMALAGSAVLALFVL